MQIPRAVVGARQLKNESGVLVISVESSGPAEKANLLEGDVIVSLDDIAVRSIDDLHKLLTDARIGASCELTLLRRSEKLNLTVVALEAAA